LELRSFESRLAKFERTTTSRAQSHSARICVLALPRVEPSVYRRTDASCTALWTQGPAVESPPERFVVRCVHAPVRARPGHAAVRACACARLAHAAGQLGPLQTATHTRRPSPILAILESDSFAHVQSSSRAKPSSAAARSWVRSSRSPLPRAGHLHLPVLHPSTPPYTPPWRRRPARPCRRRSQVAAAASP
jgi:hypothetical protein